MIPAKDYGNGKDYGNNAPVIAYVTEEVARQGHDVTTQDGIERVGWMLNAWSYALANCYDGYPTIGDVLAIGQLVEPHKNAQGFRACDVFVGAVRCPPPARVHPLLQQVFAQRATLSALAFYRGVLEVHPFVDGNGRTGKILLNWVNGTILDPIFPPADFWGRVIRNP